MIKDENAALKQKLYEMQIEAVKRMADNISIEEAVCVFVESLEGNAPRELMNQILARGAKICAVFCGDEKHGFRYVIGSEKFDVRSLCKALNEAFAGRGGGKPDMVQGSLNALKMEIKTKFDEETDKIRK